MACRSKEPRYPLSPPLLTCSLRVISDCYSVHKSGQGAAISAVGYEAQAALSPDAASAIQAIGARASASETLFESGNILFLGVLRTVDIAQAAPLMQFLPSLLSHYGQQSAACLDNHALEILVEFCSLFSAVPQGAAHLQPHYPILLQLCRDGLQGPKECLYEQLLQLLQLLLAQAASMEALGKVQEIGASTSALGHDIQSSDYRFPQQLPLPVAGVAACHLHLECMSP